MSGSNTTYQFKYQYNRFAKHWTPYGRAMYRLCYTWAMFLNRPACRWLFYLLMYTWGIITTVIGLLITLALLITGHPPTPYHGVWLFHTGHLWGGFSMGPTIVRDFESYDEDLNPHEFGHCFGQSSLLGPLMLLLVSVPSCARYWAREFAARRNKLPTTDYDDIWFEASATDIGQDVLYLRAQRASQRASKRPTSAAKKPK